MKGILLLNLEKLYNILFKIIKQSAYNESRSEIVFKLTDEEVNYWITELPFKFHEDIIELPSKEQSIYIYKPIHYKKNLKKRYTQFTIENISGIINLSSFIDSTKRSVIDLIKKWLNKHKSIKAHLCVDCTYERNGYINSGEEADKYLQTSNYEIFLASDLGEKYKDMKDKIIYEHERVSDI